MPPMPTDFDIYRGAKLLIDQHGQDALIEAVLRHSDPCDLWMLTA